MSEAPALPLRFLRTAEAGGCHLNSHARHFAEQRGRVCGVHYGFFRDVLAGKDFHTLWLILNTTLDSACSDNDRSKHR